MLGSKAIFIGRLQYIHYIRLYAEEAGDRYTPVSCVAFRIETIRKAIQAGTFEMALIQCELWQCGTGTPIVFTEPGIVSQIASRWSSPICGLLDFSIGI